MSFYALLGPLHATSDDERKARPLFAPSPLPADNGFVQAMAKRGTATSSAVTTATAATTTTTTTPNQRVILDFSKIEVDAGFAQQSLAVPYTGQCRLQLQPIIMDAAYRCHPGDGTAGVDPDFRPQQLKIHVTDALVDFNKLVRPLSRGFGASASDVLSRRTRRSRLHRRQQQQQQQQSDTSPYTSFADLDPYERAMELELEISFVGRTYTCKRSLQKVMQLRYDLLEELAVQERWYQRRSQKRSDSMDETESTLCSNCSLSDV